LGAFIHKVVRGLDGNKLAIPGQSGASLRCKMFGDSRGGKLGVGKGIRHRPTIKGEKGIEVKCPSLSGWLEGV
jgi:hypothetical protein